jgi:L-arabinose isomerase
MTSRQILASEQEVGDWLKHRGVSKSRDAICDKVEAARACSDLDDQFLVQYQLARPATNVDLARNLAQKPRLPTLSLGPAAMKYFTTHKEEFHGLRQSSVVGRESTSAKHIGFRLSRDQKSSLTRFLMLASLAH